MAHQYAGVYAFADQDADYQPSCGDVVISP
jgi:hypothetical protein